MDSLRRCTAVPPPPCSNPVFQSKLDVDETTLFSPKQFCSSWKLFVLGVQPFAQTAARSCSAHARAAGAASHRSALMGWEGCRAPQAPAPSSSPVCTGPLRGGDAAQDGYKSGGALRCSPQAVLCVTCSRGLGTDAQMLQINETKSWEVSAEDIFPFMRTWGGEGGTWWGGGCCQEQQKGGGGGQREGEIFDSWSKITQTLLPKCLHFYALKHSELWKP